MACEILVPPTRDWSWSPKRKALSPNHKTTREFSFCTPAPFLKNSCFFKCLQLKIISFPKWYIREWLILPPIYMFYKLKGKCGEPNFLRLSILKPPCSQFGFHSINCSFQVKSSEFSFDNRCACSVPQLVSSSLRPPWTLPGFSVHGIFQTRILECVSFSSSRGSPNPGIEPESPASLALQVDSLSLEPPGKPFWQQLALYISYVA